MFKILRTFQTDKLLRNHLTRQFTNYCDAGEYNFVDRLNYIGNRGIYFRHPQSSFIIRVTDDYDQCLRGNQSNDNTCWWYFPKTMRTVMENDFSEQDVRGIESAIRNWKLIQNTPTKKIDWYAATAARCYAWFSNVSTEQKLFGAKQFASTFHTDDLIEKCFSNRQFNSAADELINNLGLVFSRKGDEVTDMRKFKGQNNIPDSHIESLIETIEVQKEMMQLAEKLLRPKIFDQFVLGCHHYLSGVTAEKLLFQQHSPSKTMIRQQECEVARHRSIGFRWILSTMMTDEDTSLHLNLQNPAVDLATRIVIFENDNSGYYRDKFVDFSPMTHFDTNLSGQSDLDASRILADRSNEMKEVLVYVWENVPTENAKHYKYLAKLVGSLTDFNFFTGVRHANSRYGWAPQLD